MVQWRRFTLSITSCYDLDRFWALWPVAAVGRLRDRNAEGCNQMVELKVTGMSCQHCVRAVRDALEAVEAGTRVERMELDSGRVVVEAEVDSQALLQAVKEAGYGAQILSE